MSVWYLTAVAIAAILWSRYGQAQPADGQGGNEKKPGILESIMSKPTLKYFSPTEFGLWYPQMSVDLMQKLDAFREAWGAPVRISPAPGGIGRHGGDSSKSQHNVDYWGEVRALDVFPMVDNGVGGYRYMNTQEDRQRALETAREVGFTGIGLYVDTVPGNMLHVDVRDADLLYWTRIDGDYNYWVIA